MTTSLTNKKFIIHDLPGLKAFAKEILPEVIAAKYLAIDAPMGAGKTTLIRELCCLLGVPEGMTGSPTFSIVNEYQGSTGTIFHFDFYRMKSIEEAFDIGLEEYFAGDAICMMEWPGLVETLLPRPYLKMEISMEGNDRNISMAYINY
jgi:tRNA threonylcarbamoyladenosine biosynthesis protein TsaE